MMKSVELDDADWKLVMSHLKSVCIFSGKTDLIEIHDKMVNQLQE